MVAQIKKKKIQLISLVHSATVIVVLIMSQCRTAVSALHHIRTNYHSYHHHRRCGGGFSRHCRSSVFSSSSSSPSTNKSRTSSHDDKNVDTSSSSTSSSSPSPSPSPSSSSSLSSISKFQLSTRLNGLDKPTVWHEFSPLATKYKSINLGQGFPDWEPPTFVLDAMVQSVSAPRKQNQYCRSYAHMSIATILAQEYSERWNIDINPETQVATAVGCTNALYCTLQGILNPGDEAILLEPFFDIYSSQVMMAGGKPVYVPLRPRSTTSETASIIPDDDEGGASNGSSNSNGASQVFTLDMNEFENAITDRTKVIIINTPHNPTGKMFTRTELEQIASVVRKYPQLIVISDEVYEHIIFDSTNEPHISIATIPGMFQQTLTLSSAGKTFSCTGWKVGWAIGPPHLVSSVHKVQQWVNFSSPTPNQDAISQALQQAKQPYEGFATYYEYLANEYQRKRDILVKALQSVGMTPIIPAGGFFIMADTSQIDGPPQSYLDELTDACPRTPEMPRDWALCRWLTCEVGVTAIPPSAFYSTPNIDLASNLLRFAYCKGDDTLLEAEQRLQKYFLS